MTLQQCRVPSVIPGGAPVCKIFKTIEALDSGRAAAHPSLAPPEATPVQRQKQKPTSPARAPAMSKPAAQPTSLSLRWPHPRSWRRSAGAGIDVTEEARLVAMAQVGDPRARDMLILQSLKSIGFEAKRYWHLDAEADFMQEGVFGVIEAIKRFDLTRSVRFGTYAQWWIRDAMSRLARSSRGPAVAPEIGRSDPENVDLDRGPFEAAGAWDDVAVALPEDIVGRDQLSKQLKAALSRLTAREQLVLRARYGLDEQDEKTLRAIAEQIHLSIEAVRRLQLRAIDKLRAELAPPNAKAHCG